MKVYISADIEGITTTTAWEETDRNHLSSQPHLQQMTDEVLAVIEGAKNAGATEIVVRDAHDTARNIDFMKMPDGVTLIRGWRGAPYSMVDCIDSSFDAALFVGYHSPASRMGNPMSHTNTLRAAYIKINNIITSEFLLYSFAAALEGVPSVFLSGDKMLCEDSASLHPSLITCPVKECMGNMTINYPVKDTIRKIRELSEKALKQDLSSALVKLPDYFDVEVCFKEHQSAEKAAWFPNVSRKSDCVVTFSSNDYFEILRTILWILG